MTKSDALLNLSAKEMAVLVASGEVSSEALTQAHIARIEEVNPQLNAVVVKRYAHALAEAREADQARRRGETLGPLHGVPVSIKECLDLTGTPSTFGMRSRLGHQAGVDDPYVAQWRAAGAVVLCKTNVAQCLVYAESDNPAYGRSNNPWHVGRSCGGSSGGEAALIAARGSPLGLGTDIGGSVRTPAAFCGIAAFKPTTGRADDVAAYSLPLGQRAVLSQVGVLARHVHDLTLGLRSLGVSNSPPPPPLGAPGKVDVAHLRVGVYVDDHSFAVAPAVARATRRAAEALRAAGASTVDWTPPVVPDAVRLYFSLLSGDGGRGLRDVLRGEKPDPRVADLLRIAGMPRALRTGLRAVLRLAGQDELADFLGGFGHTQVHQHWQLVQQQMDYRARFARAMAHAGIDIILCPPFALPAYKHGASRDLGVVGGYSILWNLLGYPAGVVPVSRVRASEESVRVPGRSWVQRAAQEVERGSAGLPVGVQVVASPWREAVALAAMHTIEQQVRSEPDYPHAPTAV